MKNVMLPLWEDFFFFIHISILGRYRTWFICKHFRHKFLLDLFDLLLFLVNMVLKNIIWIWWIKSADKIFWWIRRWLCVILGHWVGIIDSMWLIATELDRYQLMQNFELSLGPSKTAALLLIGSPQLIFDNLALDNCLEYL